MTISSFLGAGAYIPQPIGWATSDVPSSFATQSTIGSGTTKYALVGRMFNKDYTSKHIKSVGIRIGTISKDATSDIQVSIEGVKTSGSFGSNDVISGATNNCKVNIGNANLVAGWVNVADFNEPSSVINFGQMISVVFKYNPFSTGFFGLSSYTPLRATTFRQTGNATFNGSSWSATDTSYALNVILVFTDGTYGTIDGSFVASAVGSVDYDGTGAITEIASEFTVPCPIAIDGAWILFETISANRPFEIKLWEDNTVLETIAVNSQASNLPANTAWMIITFANQYTLSPSRTYRLSHKNTGGAGSTQRLYYYEVSTNGHFDAAQFGRNMYYNTYNGSSWDSPVTNRRLWAGIRVCGVPVFDSVPVKRVERSYLNSVAKVDINKRAEVHQSSTVKTKVTDNYKVTTDSLIYKIAKSFRTGGGDFMPINYEVRIDKTSTANVRYIGLANIGVVGTNTAVWQIGKMDISTGLVMEWADGNDLFDNIWDDRTTLTYS